MLQFCSCMEGGEDASILGFYALEHPTHTVCQAWSSWVELELSKVRCGNGQKEVS